MELVIELQVLLGCPFCCISIKTITSLQRFESKSESESENQHTETCASCSVCKV